MHSNHFFHWSDDSGYSNSSSATSCSAGELSHSAKQHRKKPNSNFILRSSQIGVVDGSCFCSKSLFISSVPLEGMAIWPVLLPDMLVQHSCWAEPIHHCWHGPQLWAPVSARLGRFFVCATFCCWSVHAVLPKGFPMEPAGRGILQCEQLSMVWP